VGAAHRGLSCAAYRRPIGPNASFRAGNFYATVTGLFRTTHNEDEPEIQTRLIFGYSF
jgi:hypothetical protein